ncbi:MAG: hypothetical protein WBV36_11510, partial [Terriglobales bacterium]
LGCRFRSTAAGRGTSSFLVLHYIVLHYIVLHYVVLLRVVLDSSVPQDVLDSWTHDDPLALIGGSIGSASISWTTIDIIG